MGTALLNAILPAVIALYKEWRAANPNQPSLTDDQIFQLLKTESTQVVSTADAWLAAHPKAGQ